MAAKKIVNSRKLRESIVGSTMKSMRIEGREPAQAPKANTANTDRVVANLKSPSRRILG
ncbi:hypothetical protein HQQ81_17030 [Microbacteriaceae bacterium VKM Ac-2854]|nr:hypothetical protein [Microbacteriaceae bacterium VKM Ac-2854]